MSVTAEAPSRISSDSGWDNQRLGLFLFLASEAILFGTLFANYFYNRAFQSTWPPAGGQFHGSVPWAPTPLILTFLLVASGWTCHLAVEAIRRGSQKGMLGWLSATIVLGASFIGGQAFEYGELMKAGLTVNSGIYATTFYSLTGLHGTHVIVGVGLLIATFLRGLVGHFSAAHHFGLVAATVYWHFVDLVWIALFLTVYLLG